METELRRSSRVTQYAQYREYVQHFFRYAQYRKYVQHFFRCYRLHHA